MAEQPVTVVLSNSLSVGQWVYLKASAANDGGVVTTSKSVFVPDTTELPDIKLGTFPVGSTVEISAGIHAQGIAESRAFRQVARGLRCAVAILPRSFAPPAIAIALDY